MSTVNTDIGERPRLEWVALDRIDVDRNYQRDIKPRLVEKILSRFSWAKFGALVLAEKPDGRFNVVEGQHRWSAAKLHPKVDAVPAVIVSAGETTGEAKVFLAINVDRVAVTSIEQYWAGLAAGDERTEAIARVLKAAGCDVVPENSHYRPNLTNAVAALGRCLERYGAGATRRALLVIRNAWPTEPKALRGTLITALARIIRANEKTVNDEDLAKALRPQSMAKLTAHAEAIRKISGGAADTAIVKTIVELHNKGKRTNLLAIGEAR